MTEKEVQQAINSRRTVVDTTTAQRGRVVELSTEPDNTLTAAFITEGTQTCRYVDIEDLQAS